MSAFPRGPGPPQGCTRGGVLLSSQFRAYILPVSWQKGFRWGLQEGTLGARGRWWVLPRHVQTSESFSRPVCSELGRSSRQVWVGSPRLQLDAPGPVQTQAQPPLPLLLLLGEGPAENR